MVEVSSPVTCMELKSLTVQIRKMASLSLFVFSAITGCIASAEALDVEITNVKSGLICPHKIDENGAYKDDAYVCFETEDIDITGQGRCVFNGVIKLCTWYGYEFDYNNKTNTPVPLTCHFTSDRHTVLGNPNGIQDSDFSKAKVSTYEILLEPGKSHFSNPQYTLLSLAEQGTTSVTNNKCEIEGQHVFDARFNITLPVQ